jgi:glycosyltransferase involved in cell wall biosynthesis
MINFSLVIPCYNESANILVILKKYKNFLKDNNNELIIVNNGSTDNTDFLLRKYNKFKNLVTLKIKKNIGYGYGLSQGIKYSKGKNIICAHADEEISINQIIKSIITAKKYTKNNKKFFIKGSRIDKFKNHWSISDLFFSYGLSVFASMIFLRKFKDIHGYPVIFPRSLINDTKYFPRGFAIDLLHYLLAKKKNYEIKRIDVIFKKNVRTHGEGSSNTFAKKIKGSFGQIFESFKILWLN